MKLALVLGLAVGLTFGASLSSAAPAAAAGGERMMIRVDNPDTIFPPDQPDTAFVPPSRILFVNWCDGNCIIKAGQDNSRTNTSSIVRQTRTISPYVGGANLRSQILGCVRNAYSRFNITVTDVEPGNVPHFEAIAAGTPTQAGFSNGVAGVSPFTCGVIPNAITFNFLNLNPNDVLDACWTIAQESSHAFGLSHEFDGRDYMTYNPQPAAKSFVDQSLCIGTSGCCQPAQECQCGPNMQNSYQKIFTLFGGANPTPPTVSFNQPRANAAVRGGFPIEVTASDNNGVAQVQVLIDDAPYTNLNTSPFVTNGPMTLTDGTHTLTAIAVDTQGADARTTITVLVGSGCESADDCTASGDGQVCVDGRCVPGENVTGGLGTECVGGGDCASGQCAAKDGQQLCTEACDPSSEGCPGGYTCLSNGAGGGLCWPGEAAACLGCSTNKNDPTMPIGFGLVVAGLVVRRRRKRA